MENNPSLGRPIKVFNGPNDEEGSEELYTGTFHGFGVDVVGTTNGYYQIQVAIVEQPNGCLDVVGVQYCQFVTH